MNLDHDPGTLDLFVIRKSNQLVLRMPLPLNISPKSVQNFILHTYTQTARKT